MMVMPLQLIIMQCMIHRGGHNMIIREVLSVLREWNMILIYYLKVCIRIVREYHV